VEDGAGSAKGGAARCGGFLSETVDMAEAEAIYSDDMASYEGILPNYESVNH
jgi:hypothetical protein